MSPEREEEGGWGVTRSSWPSKATMKEEGAILKFIMEKNTGDRTGWKSRIEDRGKMPTWATSTFSTALFRGITA